MNEIIALEAESQLISKVKQYLSIFDTYNLERNEVFDYL